jgi:hypothetical protein
MNLRLISNALVSTKLWILSIDAMVKKPSGWQPQALSVPGIPNLPKNPLPTPPAGKTFLFSQYKNPPLIGTEEVG